MEDRQGNLPLAENLYQQAVVANPQHAGALNDLGLCLARQGKLEASVSVIEQAIRLQPAKALYRNNAATVLAEMRQDQQALGHLAAVHGVAEANYNMGQLLVGRGRAAEAAPYFQVALQHDPTMQAAQIALTNLQGADMASARVGSQNFQPAETPASGPHQAPQAGPQLQFPATALTPGYDTSSYAPPMYQAPRTPYPAAVPRVGAVYLPPVATPGRGMQR
jgi:tetratricopeptide (TPR) repeat protein